MASRPSSPPLHLLPHMNSIPSDTAPARALRRVIGRPQFFALAFGTIIGSAWLVVLNEWLSTAAPGGAILAFLAGGAAMTLMAAIYAELCARMPEAGGEFVYAYRTFGSVVGFTVGWFLILYLISVAAFEAIAFGWMIQIAFPSFAGPVLYRVLGVPVNTGGVLLGLAGLMLVTYLNARDVRIAIRFQTIVTFTFIVVAVCLLCAGASRGQLENLQPVFVPPGPDQQWWFGGLLIFANSAFFLTGFQAIPQAIEERKKEIGAGAIGRVMVISVVAATAFYCFAILCSSVTAPWRILAPAPFAPAAALRHAFGNAFLPSVLIIAAAFSLLKTWNAVVLMAARLLMALTRAGMIPRYLGTIHKVHATPSVAVYFVSAWTLVGLLLGKGAVLPLVNTSSICLAFTFVVSCIALLRLRKTIEPPPSFRAPGGNASVLLMACAATVMALIALLSPLGRTESGVPLEWTLMALWFAAGVAVFLLRPRGPCHR